MFFDESFSDLPTVLDNPYLVHFCDSRPLGKAWHSELQGRASKSLENSLSKHTDYSTGTQPYREIHDYYSIGIVLLELGSWVLLEEFIHHSPECVSDPSAFRDRLIHKYLPRLSHLMGATYTEITLACLRSEFGQAKIEGIHDSEGVPTISCST